MPTTPLPALSKCPRCRDWMTLPDHDPSIPPPPPLALDTPVVLPDLATLERFRDALQRL
jgi:hypothetical protein